ncbi:phage major tail protein, TP901-1 family [Chelativorans sp. Marseille-P2723]|uniref:phage major tail protein, TP901-1 family n=1 Tax=Chelativorans sp. Marseille-P2723 TaxID=2709133 RepID=UPI00156E6D67|nr:phage major tail protein, TP901-1 family [Chelativorans sp. Marseille-P2723]
MAAQRGKDLLLKLDETGFGNFITVAGLRTKRLAFNSETVDITDADSNGRWRELLAGSGVQRASLSGSGIFKDAHSDAAIRSRFFAGENTVWQLAIPDFGTVSGSFQITALEYAGNHDGEVTFEIALESAGPVSFAEVEG